MDNSTGIADVHPEYFEKYFPDIQWNTEPKIANPLLFLSDWWDAKTWMLWHAKVKEKYGQKRANEVLITWWEKAPFASPTTDYRTFDKPFIAYAKKEGFYDALFTGLGGLLGKTATAGTKVIDAAGDVVESAGDIVSSAGDIVGGIGKNIKTILIVVLAIIIMVAIAYGINAYKKVA